MSEKKINLSAARGAVTQVGNIIDQYEMVVEERDNLRRENQRLERENDQLKRELAAIRDQTTRAIGEPVVRARRSRSVQVTEPTTTSEAPKPAKEHKLLKHAKEFFNPPVNNPSCSTTTPEVKS